MARGAERNPRERWVGVGEALPDGLRRIARGQVDEAVEQLREPPDQDLGEAVHEARKALKRARSIARLARAGIGDAERRRANQALRDAGRRLAPTRDGDVLVETLDALRERFADEFPHEAAAGLREHLADAQGQATGALQGDGTATVVAADLEDAGRRIATWTFDHDDFRVVEPGLRRIYRQGRRACAAAREDPTPERLHEWRKRVKDLWYLAEALGETDPKPMKKRRRRARSLSKVLGQHHDLTVLREQAEKPGLRPAPPSLEALLALIDRRRARMKARALRAGRKLYADRPRKFTRRVERAWDKRTGRAPSAAEA